MEVKVQTAGQTHQGPNTVPLKQAERLGVLGCTIKSPPGSPDPASGAGRSNFVLSGPLRGHSEVINLQEHAFGQVLGLKKVKQRGKYIPLDVYEPDNGGSGGGEEALAQNRTRSELDNENSPRQIFPLKDLLRLSVMSK